MNTEDLDKIEAMCRERDKRANLYPPNSEPQQDIRMALADEVPGLVTELRQKWDQIEGMRANLDRDEKEIVRLKRALERLGQSVDKVLSETPFELKAL